MATVVGLGRHTPKFWRVPARLVTSGPAFLVGLLTEMATYARGAVRARWAGRDPGRDAR